MNTKAYLVGAGIASLASAVYLIMDGEIPPANICILEESNDSRVLFDSVKALLS